MHAKSKRFRWITVLLIGSLLGLGVWHWLHSPPTELDLKLYFGTPPEPPLNWQWNPEGVWTPFGDASYNERQLEKTDLDFATYRWHGRLYICIRDRTRLALPRYAEAVQYYPHAAVFCLPMEEGEFLSLRERVTTLLGDRISQEIPDTEVPLLFLTLWPRAVEESLRLLEADGTIDMDRLVIWEDSLSMPD